MVQVNVPFGARVRITPRNRTPAAAQKQNYRLHSPVLGSDGVKFLNDSGETIPAFGIMRIVDGVADSEYGFYLEVAKPNTTFQRFYLINGPEEVVDGKRGIGFYAFDDNKRALFDTGTPAVGEEWGAEPGEWKLTKGYPGFAIVGGENSTEVYVCQSKVNALRGKTDAAINKSASGTVSVWMGSTLGSESDTTMNVTAHNRFANVAITKWVNLNWQGNGWDMTAAEC